MIHTLKRLFLWRPAPRDPRQYLSKLLVAPDNGARHRYTEDLITPFTKACKELQRRRSDPAIWQRVEKYLNNDIPEYFKGDPVLYLCRHVASPNIQTLRFIKRFKTRGMKTIIGQDSKDLFVSHNQLKKSLGKLPICTGVYSKHGKIIEQFQKISIIDFNQWNGKPLGDVRTKWGESLVSFHNGLFSKLAKDAVHIQEDASWVDRYNRGDLLAEYKKVLALFLVHGIMFEDYPTEDSPIEEGFVTDILRPAMQHVEQELGLKPLIAPLVPLGLMSTEVWEGYPPQVLDIVREKMHI